MNQRISVLLGVLELVFPGVAFGLPHQARQCHPDALRTKRPRRAPGWSKQRKAIRGIGNGPTQG